MKYVSLNEPETIDLGTASVTGADKGSDLCLMISGAAVRASNSNNINDADVFVPEMKLTFRDYSVNSAVLCGRKTLGQDGRVRETKAHNLYKSEISPLIDRLSSENVDILSVSWGEGEAVVELNFGSAEDQLYRLTLSFSSFSAEWDEFGKPVPKKKLTLKERAAMLKNEIPAVVIALNHKDTPKTAKVISAVAVAYALSPIDLVPDFIPVIGYLDDVLILPGLLYMAIRLIPPDIMAECRQKAADMWDNEPQKRWYFAIPVAVIWILIILLIISVLK